MKFLLVSSLLSLALSASALADCAEKPISLTLAPPIDPACHALRIEGNFRMQTCDGQEGLLLGGDGNNRFLRPMDGAWFFRKDEVDPATGDRVVAILWLDPDHQKYSYADSRQDKDGNFHRGLDCAGVLAVLGD